MERRDFWRTHVRDIEEFGKTLRKGRMRELTKSAGGRPVYAIEYGEKPKIKRTANWASAMAAGRPEAFFGDTGGRTRGIVAIAGIHGAEVEGVMGIVNLASVLETGRDLAGNERKEIARAAEGLRIVLVPLANPDGRERLPIEDLIGGSLEDHHLYCQGRYADGTLMEHPDCKKLHPMPKEVEFLGGYFNDDGVNIQADCEFTNFLARETKALCELVVEEVPEAVANMHSHSTEPMFFYTGWSMPAAYDIRRAQVAEVVYGKLAERNLRPMPLYRWKEQETFAIDSLFHFLTGSLPLIVECPHGMASLPYTREEILEIQMTFHEVFLTMLKEEGLRPPLGAT